MTKEQLQAVLGGHIEVMSDAIEAENYSIVEQEALAVAGLVERLREEGHV